MMRIIENFQYLKTISVDVLAGGNLVTYGDLLQFLNPGTTSEGSWQRELIVLVTIPSGKLASDFQSLKTW